MATAKKEAVGPVAFFGIVPCVNECETDFNDVPVVHGRKLSATDEFIQCGVKKNLDKIGDPDHMMSENQGGLHVEYRAEFYDTIVTTTMCGSMGLWVDCSGSEDASSVSIEFDEDLDEALADVVVPGARLVVMCDSGDLVSRYQPVFADEDVGGYRFMIVREASVDGAKVSQSHARVLSVLLGGFLITSVAFHSSK